MVRKSEINWESLNLVTRPGYRSSSVVNVPKIRDSLWIDEIRDSPYLLTAGRTWGWMSETREQSTKTSTRRLEFAYEERGPACDVKAPSALDKFRPLVINVMLDDGDCQLALAHLQVKYSALALHSQFRKAESPIRKDACSHLMHWKMRQMFAAFSCTERCDNLFETDTLTQTMAGWHKQQSEHAKIVCMRGAQSQNRSNTSSNQTHHYQKPRNKQVAAKATKLRQWTLPFWQGIQRCIASSTL